LVKKINIETNSEIHIRVRIINFKTVRISGSKDIGGRDTSNNIWLNNNSISSKVEYRTINISTILPAEIEVVADLVMAYSKVI